MPTDDKCVGVCIAVDKDDPTKITIQSTPEQFARLIAHLSAETGESPAEMIHRITAAGISKRSTVRTIEHASASVTVVLPAPEDAPS